MLPQVSVNDPVEPCVTWKVTFCPSDGLAGLPTDRFPGDGHAEIIALGGIYGDRRRVGKIHHRRCQRSRLHRRPGRRGRRRRGGYCRQHSSPAAAPTALMKIFLRLNIWPESCSRWRVEDCWSIVPLPYQLSRAEDDALDYDPEDSPEPVLPS